MSSEYILGVPGWRLISAQVMISQFVNSSLPIGLHDDSAERAWDSLSPFLSALPLLVFVLSLSLSKVNK